MRKILLFFSILTISAISAYSLEPVRCSINNPGASGVTVAVQLYNYGTSTNVYPGTGNQSIGSLTANSSGIISFVIGDGDANWTAVDAANVTGNYVVNVFVGGNLYAQYRLDQLIQVQATAGANTEIANTWTDDQTFEGDVRFVESGDGQTEYLGFQAPADVTTDLVWTLPAGDGSGGQMLSTNGSGTLSWATPGLTNFTESSYTYSGKTGVKLLATNGATNADVVLQPKGNGGIIVNEPDGTSTGGNNRGTNAVDLQSTRTSADEVASGPYSAVGGGALNEASGQYSTVSAGSMNNATKLYATVGGGWNNTAGGENSTVGGGYSNNASADDATVGGGNSNQATDIYATIGGGLQNQATADYATSSGGNFNRANFDYSTTSGGNNNQAGAVYSTIGGGSNNQTTGDYATIPGGLGNIAPSYGETVLGLYPTTYAANSSNSINANDRLLNVGNGSGTGARSDAFTILKNGNTTVGGSLTINNNGTNTSVALPTGRGTNGQVLTTNGSGGTSWAAAGGGGYTFGKVSKTTPESRTNTTLADDTDFSISWGANAGTYKIKIMFQFVEDGDGLNARLERLGGGTPTFEFITTFPNNTTNSTYNLTGFAGTWGFVAEGIMVVPSTVTGLKLQWSKNSNSNGNTTINRGIFYYEKVE